MLVIIDMQNHILDPNSEFYIPESINWQNVLLKD